MTQRTKDINYQKHIEARDLAAALMDQQPAGSAEYEFWRTIYIDIDREIKKLEARAE